MRALLIISLLGLSACGADGPPGPPGPPEVSAQSTIGINSRTGVYGGTEIGIRVGL